MRRIWRANIQKKNKLLRMRERQQKYILSILAVDLLRNFSVFVPRTNNNKVWYEKRKHWGSLSSFIVCWNLENSRNFLPASQCQIYLRGKSRATSSNKEILAINTRVSLFDWVAPLHPSMKCTSIRPKDHCIFLSIPGNLYVLSRSMFTLVEADDQFCSLFLIKTDTLWNHIILH